MGIYEKFANYYDELMYDVDYEKWFNYVENIFEHFDKKPRSILEMACGTGNFTYYLCKKGYKVTCFDMSLEMLSMAYNKLYEFKNVNIISQNMINFNLNKKYDVILSICDAINYIIDERDLFKTFKNVYNHLNEDGIFIFDINSYYKLKNIIGNNIFVEDRENVFYVWQNNFDTENNIANFYLNFFIKDRNNYYTRFDEEHIERAYRIEEVIDALTKANFTHICYYKNLTSHKPNKKTERICFVVSK